jgi:hypothetical protein
VTSLDKKNVPEYINISRLQELVMKGTSQMSGMDRNGRSAILRTPWNLILA